ncbi:MAG: crosslink repair DNA glycosylase YcaQ family protein [Minwuia sp.]|nr:crosslink repair DNA glycosylase YcaQ family protein [Minwuia sp.]
MHHVHATFARRVLLDRQQLTGNPRVRMDNDGLQSLIDRLGFVQIDSISTVERAHHMILFARNTTYQPAQLQTLLERENSLFENWTHDASVLPSRFFPIWRRRFLRDGPRILARWRNWREEGFEAQFEQVLDHIRQNGPVKARDLAPGGRPSGGWWDWHPSKTALEYLWRTGAICVRHREGFEKVYDLTENVIPAAHREETYDEPAFIDWACRSAIERLGLATTGEIAAFWGVITPAEAKSWSETKAGDTYPRVTVDSVNDQRPRVALADPSVLDLHPDDMQPPTRLRVLSPFDPVIRDRKRCERLFGFDYRIEIFTPAAKRQYGYYVFPLLEGEHLVGRIDMKRQADTGTLAVRRIWWEPGVRQSRQRDARLMAELDRVRRFVGMTDIRFADGWRG